MKTVFDSATAATPRAGADPNAWAAERCLADLEPGDSAIVAGVGSEDAAGRRLLDLGFLPGTPVHAIRRAPLGDPSVYELRGYRLCLRRSEARRIRVRASSAAAAPPARA